MDGYDDISKKYHRKNMLEKGIASYFSWIYQRYLQYRKLPKTEQLYIFFPKMHLIENT